MITNGHGIPVVALDIDGTLGDYHGNFIRFASLYFDLPNLAEDRLGRENPGLPLWSWLGISHRDYQDAKLAYRQGGWKRWMLAYEGAAPLTRNIKLAGAEVWLCTTRPYLRLDNIDPDTREWLRRNRIEYDALLFDLVEEKGSKYRELKRQAGNRVASILEDLPELADRAIGEGLPTPILRSQPYNLYRRDFTRRVENLYDAWTLVGSDLKSWREQHG